MTVHPRISATRESLHGTYHKSNSPILSIRSGDEVLLETLEVGWRTERVLPGKSLQTIQPRDPLLDDGPALTGPIFVEGARAGSTLEIQFLEFKPRDWGWNSGGGSVQRIEGLTGVDEEKVGVFWEIDRGHKTVTNQWGHSVELSPFLGCVGVASHDDERLPGWYPHPRCGGNMDANVLTVGTSLFLPVEVEGALLSVGDAHAAQGDGEISGTGIECPMEEVRLKIVLHPKLSICSPRAKRKHEWITFGMAETLDLAAVMAINAMLDLLQEHTDLTRSEALAVSSSCVDLRVTQMVNPLKGMHAVLTIPVASLRKTVGEVFFTG